MTVCDPHQSCAKLVQHLQDIRDGCDSWASSATALGNAITALESWQGTEECTSAETRRPQTNGNSALLTEITSAVRLAVIGTGACRRSRHRALALDSLRLSVSLLLTPAREASAASGEQALGEVLSVAAEGARDEHWAVRLAAVRTAGEGLRHNKRTRLLRFLSSAQGCWLPALLVEEYAEVSQAARAALDERLYQPEQGDIQHPTDESPLVLRTAAAILHGACEILRAGSKVDGDDVIDRVADEAAQMALRAAHGSLLLFRSGDRRGQDQEARSAFQTKRVEVVELIEAWLVGKLRGPPGSVAWEDGKTCGAAGEQGLSTDVRDAVRALLTDDDHLVLITAMEAVSQAVEAFCVECSRLHSTSSDGGDEAEEKSWRRLYCGLLVRTEAMATDSAHDWKTSPQGDELKGIDPDSLPDGAHSIRASGDRLDVASEHSSAVDLANKLANALNAVPCAYDQALPIGMDEDDTLSAREKDDIRTRGTRRRRWLASCSALLLRAGARFCGRYRRSSSPGPGISDEIMSTIVKLVAAALPFGQASIDADEPSRAFLSSVLAAAPSKPRAMPPLGTDGSSSPKAAAHVYADITQPVRWEACVNGLALPVHGIPAPWAADPLVNAQATGLVEAAWEQLLPLTDEPLTAAKNAEAIVLALRQAARDRGWREDRGVGIKHAIAGVIRRLRFPVLEDSVLGHALPLVLPLADDYDASHQAVGLSLLLHIEAEAIPTELAWHSGLLLEILERGVKASIRDPSVAMLCLAATVALLQRVGSNNKHAARSSGLRIARQALAQAGRTSDGELRTVMVCGAAALLELPGTASGYAPCELLRPALLGLLPILQSTPVTPRLDTRAATLRALNALCCSCWPRVHSHTSKLLCALLWACADCSRRAVRRDAMGDAAMPLDMANGATIHVDSDETVRRHATNLGALVLLLGGDAASSTLEQICEAVAALRPAGAAMKDVAKRAQGNGPEDRKKGGSVLSPLDDLPVSASNHDGHARDPSLSAWQ